MLGWVSRDLVLPCRINSYLNVLTRICYQKCLDVNYIFKIHVEKNNPKELGNQMLCQIHVKLQAFTSWDNVLERKCHSGLISLLFTKTQVSFPKLFLSTLRFLKILFEILNSFLIRCSYIWISFETHILYFDGAFPFTTLMLFMTEVQAVQAFPVLVPSTTFEAKHHFTAIMQIVAFWKMHCKTIACSQCFKMGNEKVFYSWTLCILLTKQFYLFVDV